MLMKKIFILVFVLLSLNSVAQTIEFKDEAFKNAVLANGVDLDKDHEIQLTEALACTVLDVSSKDIVDLTEISYFKNLKELACNWNKLTKIDLSKNDSLEILSCASNQLTTIDLINNKKLQQLSFDENPIVNISFVENLLLTKVTCSKTKLVGLDFHKNIKLFQLNCTNNPDLTYVIVPNVQAAMANKKFKKDENVVWQEKSKAAQGQRR
ncbi:MAG: hypothetical protein RLZZ175_133 [Bacteroidota bacterium]